MSVEVNGFYKGHDVSLDAVTDWPTVNITCTCGWTTSVNGETDDGLKDAISRVWIHTGGPAQDSGGEVVHIDHNMLDSFIDERISEAKSELGIEHPFGNLALKGES